MKLFVYFVVFLLLPLTVFAEDFFIIDAFQVKPLSSSLVSSDESIYVGSSIMYDVSFHYNGTNPLENQEIQVQIINQNGNIIDEKNFTFNFTNNQTHSLNSSADNDLLRLIYADIPGVYKLKLTSKSVMLFLREERAFRQDHSIPLFFEVRKPEEKRMLDSIKDMIKNGETLVQESKSSTDKILLVSLTALLISALTLLATPQGPNVLRSFFKMLLKVIAFIIAVIIVNYLLKMFKLF
ncbi:hypothetical protein HYV85_02335 [Candidatus Woesearchaeota archaeon]|nr:hypothetical protein [Candidatus Woesearchaeota archaeon]